MMSTQRPLGEVTVKNLRRLAAEGATLDAMSRETGLRITEVEDAIAKHGIVRHATSAGQNGAQPAFQHRKIEWQVIPAIRGRGGLTASYAPSTGVLTLTKAAVELVGPTTHVVVLWSAAERLIGVRAAKPDDAGARKLTRQIKMHSLMAIAGLELVKRTYPCRKEGDVLVIDVNAEVSA